MPRTSHITESCAVKSCEDHDHEFLLFTELFSDAKGPLPTHNVFGGMSFLLTHVDGPPSPSKVWPRRSKPGTSTEYTTTDESMIEGR